MIQIVSIIPQDVCVVGTIEGIVVSSVMTMTLAAQHVRAWGLIVAALGVHLTAQLILLFAMPAVAGLKVARENNATGQI